MWQSSKPRIHKLECYFCQKFTGDVVQVYIDNNWRYVCRRCYLARLLRDTILSMLKEGSLDNLQYIIRVLEGINDLIEDNPNTQAIRYVIDMWSQKFPERELYIRDLASNWSYKIPLQKILEYLLSMKIFEIKQLEIGKIISPGPLLKKLLEMHSSSREFFQCVVKVLTGLATVSYLVDPKNKKLRKIYAVFQAINAYIDDNSKIPYYEIKGYKCKICNAIFKTTSDINDHVSKTHNLTDREASQYREEIFGDIKGYWCEYSVFVEKASVYGVKKLERLKRDLISRGVIIPREGEEIVMRIRDRNGIEREYVLVDIAWFRVRERMRALERELRRVR